MKDLGNQHGAPISRIQAYPRSTPKTGHYSPTPTPDKGSAHQRSPKEGKAGVLWPGDSGRRGLLPRSA